MIEKYQISQKVHIFISGRLSTCDSSSLNCQYGDMI